MSPWLMTAAGPALDALKQQQQPLPRQASVKMLLLLLV
jgi:hypothetical protein